MYNLINIFNKRQDKNKTNKRIKRSKLKSKRIKISKLKSKCRSYNRKTKKCNYLKGG